MTYYLIHTRGCNKVAVILDKDPTWIKNLDDLDVKICRSCGARLSNSDFRVRYCEEKR